MYHNAALISYQFQETSFVTDHLGGELFKVALSVQRWSAVAYHDLFAMDLSGISQKEPVKIVSIEKLL